MLIKIDRHVEDNMINQIRTVEIESENIHSIGFGASGDNYAEKLEIIKKSQRPAIHVSQKNVERLIKD